MAGDRVFNFNGANVTFNDIHDNTNCTIIVPRGEKIENERPSTNGALPAELSTDRAQELLRRLQEAGLLDENYQPLCSKTQAALIAGALSDHLQLQPRWALIKQFWGIPRMAAYFDKAINQASTLDFQDRITHILAK